jgi:hypothetical protein
MRSIPKAELDGILQHFLADIVKKIGENYEPEFLKVMLAALDCHIRESCGFSLQRICSMCNNTAVLSSVIMINRQLHVFCVIWI